MHISHDYETLYTEVYKVLGLNYQEFQESVQKALLSLKIDGVKNKSILDIGCGDGATLAPLVNEGFTNLTGIDTNDEMLEKARTRFEKTAKILKINATDLSQFKTKEFFAVVSSMCIHNIPRQGRKNFFAELKRLQPQVFIDCDKITNEDAQKHIEAYERETQAIIEVYKNRHNMPEAARYWLDHFIVDEKEALTMSEIKNELGDEYDISVFFEKGMCKTVLAVRK